MTNSVNPLTEVLEALISRGLARDAQELQAQIIKLSSLDPTERDSAAKAIAGMCHPKWLGDLDVHRQDWWELLDRARTFARRASKAPPKALS